MNSKKLELSILRSTYTRFKTYETTYIKVCYKYLKNLAVALKLLTIVLNKVELRDRILTIYSNFNNIRALKTDDVTYKWFYESARPTRPTDRLGIYRFFLKSIKELEIIYLNEDAARVLYAKIWTNERLDANFDTIGNIVLLIFT